MHYVCETEENTVVREKVCMCVCVCVCVGGRGGGGGFGCVNFPL